MILIHQNAVNRLFWPKGDGVECHRICLFSSNNGDILLYDVISHDVLW